ncbi:DUF899 family protein [Aquicoccus porphyridii]|uniref:DUF899 family protein n=1 Tax=Aquicoccus porphyridii TaxID=1852029 RepID=UPI00273F8C88|nr:DUF899 family protein [Aquicoccus porphyridii]
MGLSAQERSGNGRFIGGIAEISTHADCELSGLTTLVPGIVLNLHEIPSPSHSGKAAGRRGHEVFETYWTTRRGVEAMDNSYRLLDLTVYGRQEDFEDSPDGWPQRWGETNHPFRRDGRPISQWRRLEAGHSDDLGVP